jgi:hypothetical protein
MPVHDWTRVDAGIFHDFHIAWITELRNVFNGGLLPPGYYALSEQHAGRRVADLLTLHATTPTDSIGPRPRSLAIRHVSGHHLVSLVEIITPGNKDNAQNVSEFVNKAKSAFERGIQLLLVDLFPPSIYDLQGMHGAIWYSLIEDPYDLPADMPLTLASYVTTSPPEVYLEPLALGGLLPDMPLFLRPDRYINVPLETTYQAAYRGVPEFWRNVLEKNQKG